MFTLLLSCLFLGCAPQAQPGPTPSPVAVAEAAPEQANDGMIHCSFCGKSQKEVDKIIAGPSVYICDECVELCHQIITEHEAKPEDPP